MTILKAKTIFIERALRYLHDAGLAPLHQQQLEHGRGALVNQIRVGRASTPSELKSAGDSHDWGPGDVRTQLSASQHCTDQSAEAQHWL